MCQIDRIGMTSVNEDDAIVPVVALATEHTKQEYLSDLRSPYRGTQKSTYE